MTSAIHASKNEHAPTTPSAKHTVPQLSYSVAAFAPIIDAQTISSIQAAVRDWEYEGGLVTSQQT